LFNMMKPIFCPQFKAAVSDHVRSGSETIFGNGRDPIGRRV
jgi:hypothetical protein